MLPPQERPVGGPPGAAEGSPTQKRWGQEASLGPVCEIRWGAGSLGVQEVGAAPQLPEAEGTQRAEKMLRAESQGNT